MESEQMVTEKNIPFLDANKAAGEQPQAAVKPPGDGEKPLSPQQKRRRLTRLSAVIAIIIPTILAGIYYGLVATSQYAVEVRFAVRGINASSGSDLLSMMTGIPSGGSTVADSYILMDYIHSREIFEKLHKKLDLSLIYGSERADFLSSFSPDEPIEEFVKYWKKMTTISFDSSSQIVVVEVRAFTQQDAKKVAEAVLELSGELVNNLSANARRDAVSYAEIEVARMEKRLRANRKAVRTFREREQVIDPSKTAESQLGILSQLEVQLATEKATYSALTQFLDKDSPRIKILIGKIKALEKQVLAERAALGASKSETGGALAGLLEDYRILLMDQEFAEKAYISALTSLETARIEAGRQHRYLATFVKPSLPEDSLYPKRLLNILLTFVVSMIIWAIGTLIVYAVRDHAT